MKDCKFRTIIGIFLCFECFIISCSNRNIILIEDITQDGFSLYEYLALDSHNHIAAYKDGNPLSWDTVNNSILIKGELHNCFGSMNLLEYCVPKFGNPGVIKLDSLNKRDKTGKYYKELYVLDNSEYKKLRESRFEPIYYNEKTLNPENYKFELICGKEIYGNFTQDSVGIFNSLKKEHARYRRINEISSPGWKLVMCPEGNLYNFHYRWPRNQNKDKSDSSMPMWCRAYLPGGFKKLVMPTYNDFIWDYGDNQYVWMHLDHKGKDLGLSRPVEMTPVQTDSIIEKFFIEDFPAQLMNMGDVKKKLLTAKENESIRLRTNRVTIISSRIKRENLSLFRTIYKEACVEESFATLENLLKFTRALDDFCDNREFKPDELIFDEFLYDYLSIPEEMKDSFDRDDLVSTILMLMPIEVFSVFTESTLAKEKNYRHLAPIDF